MKICCMLRPQPSSTLSSQKTDSQAYTIQTGNQKIQNPFQKDRPKDINIEELLSFQ